MNGAVPPALNKGGVHAEARALDHGGMSVEVTGTKERGENVGHHRGAECRKQTRASNHSAVARHGQDVGRVKIVESIRLTASGDIDFPAQTIGKDAGAQLVMAMEKLGFFDISRL
ncbi:hypothetical protein ILFOPFJJ_05800 [Ensifer psoraleae]|nr:hypothetical protein [Sinorhizobium psoraleae]